MQTNQIVILVVMGAAFYFLLLRPQQQQAKRQAETIASLTPGTRIVTIGGIVGTVVSVTDERVRISVVDGSELEIVKRAVGSILPDEDDDTDVDDDVDDTTGEDAPMLDDASADAGTEGSSANA